MLPTITQAELDFIDNLGLVAEGDGLTRITGRIWGLLILSEFALAPAEIAQLLQVSRASVSMGIKSLESFELLNTKTRPGERQSYYEMREQPYISMIEMHVKRAQAQEAVVNSALQQIQQPLARKRLGDLQNFYAIFREGFANMHSKLEALKR